MLQLRWMKQAAGNYRANGPLGAVFTMGANQETVTVRLGDGRKGYGWTEQEAWQLAQAAPATAPGVLPMRCDVCEQVFGVINAPAYAADLAADAAHYFCKACLALPEAEVEEQLAGKGCNPV